jgi:hypothetical protein
MGLILISQSRASTNTWKREVVITSAEFCESCGKEIDSPKSVKNLEENFINESRQNMHICTDCFNKRFKIVTKKRSGYGGTIYELENRSPPRFGIGSQPFTCLKCNWVAWTEEGLRAHMIREHP